MPPIYVVKVGSNYVSWFGELAPTLLKAAKLSAKDAQETVKYLFPEGKIKEVS